MAKRATLPKADELLIGRPVAPTPGHTTTAIKNKKTIVLKGKSTIERKGEKPKVIQKTQTSIHLTTDTLKRLEEVKYRLFADYNLKAKKSTIVEVALQGGLANLEQLVQVLRAS